MLKAGFLNPKYEKFVIKEANRFTTLMNDENIDGLSTDKTLYLKLSIAKSSIYYTVSPDEEENHSYSLVLGLFKDLYENLQLGSMIKDLNLQVSNVIDMITILCSIDYNNNRNELLYWHKIFNGIGSLCKIESTIHIMAKYGKLTNVIGDSLNPEISFVSDRFIRLFINYPNIYKILGVDSNVYHFIKAKHEPCVVSTEKTIDFTNIPKQIKDNKSIQHCIDHLEENVDYIDNQMRFSCGGEYFTTTVDSLITAIYDGHKAALSKGTVDAYDQVYYLSIYNILIGLGELCKFNTNAKVNDAPQFFNIIKLLSAILKCLCSENNMYSSLDFIEMTYSLNKLVTREDPYINNTNIKLTDAVLEIISFNNNISREGILEDIINLEKKYHSDVNNVALECYSNKDFSNNDESSDKEEEKFN